MNFRLAIVVTAIFILPSIGYTQRADTLYNKLDSSSKRTDSVGSQHNNISEHAYDADTRINFQNYFVLLGSDLKQEFTKPFHMTKKDWGNFGKFALVEGALAFADKPVQKEASSLEARNSGLHNVSKLITQFGGPYEAITLGAFGAYGYIFNNQKMKTTTLLATQAYITGGALESVLKFVSGRTRPSYYAPTEEARPRFLGPFSKTAQTVEGKKSYSSFPSGHTTVAFAAATVFALEYYNKPWVPILSYTAASLIGLSRIAENKHWTTDVIAGAAVGFLAGKNVVNNYHRFAKIKRGEKQKSSTKSLSLNLQYYNRQLVPGLVYKF